jgi:hypothetical protein
MESLTPEEVCNVPGAAVVGEVGSSFLTPGTEGESLNQKHLHGAFTLGPVWAGIGVTNMSQALLLPPRATDKGADSVSHKQVEYPVTNATKEP